MIVAARSFGLVLATCGQPVTSVKKPESKVDGLIMHMDDSLLDRWGKDEMTRFSFPSRFRF